MQVGVGSYEEGSTGLTILRFPDRATAVVDVRGGAPGTVKTDALRLGYGAKAVDAIVAAGGSDYGEEAITAVMTGLKDAGALGGDGPAPSLTLDPGRWAQVGARTAR